MDQCAGGRADIEFAPRIDLRGLIMEKYEAPALTEVGTVEELTAGSHTPSRFLDASFPAHTPFKKLTFS
jgi:hypothetical protein